MAKLTYMWSSWSPPRVIAGSFVLVIAVGTLLLRFPAAANDGALSWLEALFTATSATCVTGLVVVDTGTRLSPLGQGIVLALIQVGGLGITVFSTLALVLMGRRLSLHGREAIAQVVGSSVRTDVPQLVLRIVATTLVLEGLGAALLFSMWPLGTFRSRMAGAVFHTVSAFNNAGFSTLPQNLVSLQGQWGSSVVIAMLIVLGGIGFPVIWELLTISGKLRRRERFLITVHTKVVLTMTLALLTLGTISILLLESDGALSHLGVTERWVAAAFHAVTPRTAGFNTIPIPNFHAATLFILVMFMFVGGSPGSTAGGVKTTTLGILLAFVRSRARGRDTVDLFRRTVSPEDVRRAVAVVAAACSILIVAIIVLLVAEDRAPAPILAGIVSNAEQLPGIVEPLLFFDLMFEAVSALGTVGLSTGITPSLGPVGRITIIILMFIGRVGPLTIALALGPGASRHTYTYPKARVMTG
jgi:trk system potassium uptake protein TrkH